MLSVNTKLPFLSSRLYVLNYKQSSLGRLPLFLALRILWLLRAQVLFILPGTFTSTSAHECIFCPTITSCNCAAYFIRIGKFDTTTQFTPRSAWSAPCSPPNFPLPLDSCLSTKSRSRLLVQTVAFPSIFPTSWLYWTLLIELLHIFCSCNYLPNIVLLLQHANRCLSALLYRFGNTSYYSILLIRLSERWPIFR